MKRILSGLGMVVFSVSMVSGFIQFGIPRTLGLLVLGCLVMIAIVFGIASFLMALITFVVRKKNEGVMGRWYAQFDEHSIRRAFLSVVVCFISVVLLAIVAIVAGVLGEQQIDKLISEFFMRLILGYLWVPYFSVYLISFGLAGGLVILEELRKRRTVRIKKETEVITVI